MNEILDRSMICPCAEVLLNVLTLVNKILTCFQKEFKQVVDEAEDMDMHIFCSLTNSNIKFLAAMKTFINRVVKLGILTEVEVMQVLSYNTAHSPLCFDKKLRSDIKLGVRQDPEAKQELDCQ